MSVKRRKVTYWSINFIDKHDDSCVFDSTLFCKFLEYAANLPDEQRVSRDGKSNKAVSLLKIDKKEQGVGLYKIIFKSCKYNHSPEYMSSIDGSERPSNKRLDEGDKELTHMCVRIDEDEAYSIFEERRNGVTMKGIMVYFNSLLVNFLEQKNIDRDLYLRPSAIPSEDFLQALENANRISIAELFTEREILGSDYLNLIDIDENSRNELQIIIKSKPREGLIKRKFKDWFNHMASEETRTKRIRLHGVDDDHKNIIIDSLNGKRKKEIDVDLTDNGVVDSSSIFSRMEELLDTIE